MTTTTINYPAGGWLPPKAKFVWERSDQGRDFITDWNGVIQAPGNFRCVNIGSDGQFPTGFGPDYPWVEITSGWFSGHMFYIGHCSSLVHVGQSGAFGTPLARANQGNPKTIGIPISGGWVELGEVQPSGILGPNSPTGHWFDNLLRRDFIQHITDPDPYHYTRFPTGPFRDPRGHRINERETVEEYDRLRPDPKRNQQRLAELLPTIIWLRKRVWSEAHNPLKHGKPTWDIAWRGWRWQQLNHRSNRLRIGYGFHA